MFDQIATVYILKFIEKINSPFFLFFCFSHVVSNGISTSMHSKVIVQIWFRFLSIWRHPVFPDQFYLWAEIVRICWSNSSKLVFCDSYANESILFLGCVFLCFVFLENIIFPKWQTIIPGPSLNSWTVVIMLV